MIASLWRKELREHAWVLVVPAAQVGLEVADCGLDGRLPSADGWFVGAGSVAATLAMVGFAVGIRVANGEREAGTQRFLDALPVSRGAVFATKYGAAVAMVSLAHALMVAPLVPMWWLGGSSLAPDPRLDLVGIACLLGAAAAAVSVALGTALARVGSLAWPMAATAWMVVLAAQREAPVIAALSPSALATPRLLGVAWVPDTTTAAVQAALGAAALAVGAILYVREGRGRGWVVPTWAGRLGWGGAFVVLLAVVATLAEEEDEEEPDEVVRIGGGVSVVSDATATLETARYRFRYDPARAARVRELAAEADGIAAEVSRRIGLPLGEVIEVDTSGTMDNTEGTAFSGSIRMQMSDDAALTLAHETSHVLCGARAAASTGRGWSHATVFNEGLATWAARPPNAPTMVPPSVIALSQRGQLELTRLLDAAHLQREFDTGLTYDVGVLLVDALVAVAGEAAIPGVVGAFADLDEPTGAGDAGWYFAAFQAAGVDLPRVLAVVEAAVAAAVAADTEIAALPRPRAYLVKDGDRVGVKVDGADGHEVAVRFRPSPEAPIDRYRAGALDEAGVAWRSAAAIEDGQVCFQAGLRLAGGTTLYEPWGCVAVEAAE
jgi:hypothetical protein